MNRYEKNRVLAVIKNMKEQLDKLESGLRASSKTENELETLAMLGRIREERQLTKEEWDTVPFGEVSDREISILLGYKSDNAVGTQRRRRGVSSFVAPITDWNMQPLGKVSDRVLAKRMGCSPSTVWEARVDRGIQSFAERRRANKKRCLPQKRK